uniref:Uncharacterized protein n=1 Tax=Romanomermis culicivorax TaxID=13658 RepID=A0A915KR56_ROMCU
MKKRPKDKKDKKSTDRKCDQNEVERRTLSDTLGVHTSEIRLTEKLFIWRDDEQRLIQKH